LVAARLRFIANPNNKEQDEDKSENNQQASRTSNRLANKPKPNYRENRSYVNRNRIFPALSENESEAESNLGENKFIKEKNRRRIRFRGRGYGLLRFRL